MAIKKIKQKNIIWLLIFTLIGFPHFIFAQTLSSPTYNLEDSDFSFGGERSSSTNYSSLDEMSVSGSEVGTSTNYKVFGGDVLPWFPSTPPTPTLTNTTGQLYDALDFVVTTGDNQTDTNYAIAISTDDFVTTYFIQADLTVGTTTIWQDYTTWGAGSGARITGLSANTTYKIKTKARYGPDSETGYSQTASASTVGQTLTFSITGIASGASTGGATTNLTATATTIPFNTLAFGSGAKIGAQTLNVTTNALNGYTVYLYQDGDLRKSNGSTISALPYPNANPGAWPNSISNGYFGYHTTDSTLCTGSSNRFASSDTFAAASTSPYEVACNTGPASNDTTDIIFKAEIGPVQPAGSYQNKIIYILTAGY